MVRFSCAASARNHHDISVVLLSTRRWAEMPAILEEIQLAPRKESREVESLLGLQILSNVLAEIIVLLARSPQMVHSSQEILNLLL